MNLQKRQQQACIIQEQAVQSYVRYGSSRRSSERRSNGHGSGPGRAAAEVGNVDVAKAALEEVVVRLHAAVIVHLSAALEEARRFWALLKAFCKSQNRCSLLRIQVIVQ